MSENVSQKPRIALSNIIPGSHKFLFIFKFHYIIKTSFFGHTSYISNVYELHVENSYHIGDHSCGIILTLQKVLLDGAG